MFTLINLRLDTGTSVRKGFKALWRRSLPIPFYKRRENYYYYPQEERVLIPTSGLYLFYFFVFIRLVILSEPYLFIIFNFFFTFFLISNKYLITSSIIGLLLAVSRWTFFLEDKNYSEFKEHFAFIEEIEENESLYPNWENTVSVSIFITRFLRKDFSEGITSKEDKLAYDSSSCLPGYLAEGCIELSHPIVEKTKFITYKWFNAGYFEEEEKPEYNEFEWGISSLELYIRNRYRKDMRDGTNKNDSEFVKLMDSLYKKKEKISL